MTEDQPRDPPGGEGPDIGSLGEETAKLFQALAGAAREHGHQVGEGVEGMAEHLTQTAHQINDHVATDAAECQYCPVCRAISLVRDVNPEVRAHLTVAASSLAQAAAGLLATPPPYPSRQQSGGVEHIDVDEDGDPDPDNDSDEGWT